MAEDHNQLLAATVKPILAAQGFIRKGRSRVWLADRGYWVAVVEFQSSGFGRGSYLNVSAHWLWSVKPEVLSFDYLVGDKPWCSFEDEDQWTAAATGLANQAVERVGQLDALFPDIATTATILGKTADSDREWRSFNAAMAFGLAGDITAARRFFAAVEEGITRRWPHFAAELEPYAAALSDEAGFQLFLAQRIQTQREIWKLGV